MDKIPAQPLPQPSQPFEWLQGRQTALVCRPLLAVADHLFTTRGWALGARPAVGEDGAWDEVAAALNVPAERLVRARQVHGAAILVAAGPPVERPEADILITNRGDLVLAVQAADCVPLLIADPRTCAVAAAHAGWRGLAAGVPGATVAALSREYGSRPADLVAAIGPSIGPCCYEVGADVREAFRAAFPSSDWTGWFAPGRQEGRWMFDTWRSARAQLEAAGLPSARIFDAGLCTASLPDVFCSYRRDGPPAGRIAGAIRSRRSPRHP